MYDCRVPRRATTRTWPPLEELLTWLSNAPPITCAIIALRIARANSYSTASYTVRVLQYTVDREIFVVKNFSSTTLTDEN